MSFSELENNTFEFRIPDSLVTTYLHTDEIISNEISTATLNVSNKINLGNMHLINNVEEVLEINGDIKLNNVDAQNISAQNISADKIYGAVWM